jgi:hypothetical protein
VGRRASLALRHHQRLRGARVVPVTHREGGTFDRESRCDTDEHPASWTPRTRRKDEAETLHSNGMEVRGDD